MAHKSLFIIDNSSEANSVKSYISQWCSISKQLDIASGYFEVGGLLALGEEWQKLDKIRIILGNEVTKRTKNIIDEVASMRVHSLVMRVTDVTDFDMGIRHQEIDDRRLAYAAVTRE